MQTLLIHFFPAKWVLGVLVFDVVCLLLNPSFALAILLLCVELFFGFLALLAYYASKHEKIVKMVSEKVVLSFIRERPYKCEDETKRMEIWGQMAAEANDIVEQKYSVRNYFSAEEIEKLLNSQIRPTIPILCQNEGTGWESVLLVARNIRTEDTTAFWNKRLPSGVMEQYNQETAA